MVDNKNNMKILISINQILETIDNVSGKLNKLEAGNIRVNLFNINKLLDESLIDILTYYKDVIPSDESKNVYEIEINKLESFIKSHNIDKENIIDLVLSKDIEANLNKTELLNYIMKRDNVDNSYKIKMVIDIVKDFLVNGNNKYSPEYSVAKTIIHDMKGSILLDRKAFKESKELAVLFKELVSAFDYTGLHKFEANKKRLGIMLLNRGLVSYNYEQVIDNDSNEDGLKTIVNKLVSIGNYGTIRILMSSEYNNFSEEDYIKILRYSVGSFPIRERNTDKYIYPDKVDAYLNYLTNIIFPTNEDNIEDSIEYVKE